MRLGLKMLAIAVIASTILVTTQVLLMADGQTDQLARYAEIQRRHLKELLRMPGVTGVAVGSSQTMADTPVIRLYVAPGTPEDVKRGLPKDVEGAPVEILEREPPQRD